MSNLHYELGSAAASEAVIRDLYLNLRIELARWSAVTRQTAQARMGYMGQHLVSVVTGHLGGRSGARGKDLVLPNGGSAEIKTCYRVDQLGRCKVCKNGVAPAEITCSECGSVELVRKNDSKWLISPKHDADMRALFNPISYYLVLFDFEDFESPDVINAKIYEIDPRQNGFTFCMIDYYFNIRMKSVSKAPFNLWPYSLKFQLMEPVMIYQARIRSDNSIDTRIFPGEVGNPELIELDDLTTLVRATGLSIDTAQALARRIEIEPPEGATKLELLALVESARIEKGWTNSQIVGALCEAMYGPKIRSLHEWLPDAPRSA